MIIREQEVLTWDVSLCISDRMAKCELIELKDLSVNDPIELAAPVARTATPPIKPVQPSLSHVVRLIGDSVSIEAPSSHTGEAAVGHDFQPYSYTHLTWCDLCGEFIWGLYKQSLRCTSKCTWISVILLVCPWQPYYVLQYIPQCMDSLKK